MENFKNRLLIKLSKNWYKNKGKDYSQTWYYMPKKFRNLRKIIQCICGLWDGHELSNTEWGYGGGQYADRWCRWCDKRIKVPKDSIRFNFKDSPVKTLMDKVGVECENGKCKL